MRQPVFGKRIILDADGQLMAERSGEFDFLHFVPDGFFKLFVHLVPDPLVFEGVVEVGEIVGVHHFRFMGE
jgi:hypothetical protein